MTVEIERYLFCIKDTKIQHTLEMIGKACSRAVLSKNEITSHMWLLKEELN